MLWWMLLPMGLGLEPLYHEQQHSEVSLNQAYLKDAWVLLIGVNSYQLIDTGFGVCNPSLLDLPGAKRDILGFHSLMTPHSCEGKGGADACSQQNILMHHDQQTSKANILASFQEIARLSQIQKRAMFFLAWAGHGIQCRAGEVGEKEIYALVTRDAYLSLSEIKQQFESESIRVEQRVMALDTCHSGAVMNFDPLIRNQAGSAVGTPIYLVSSTSEQSSHDDHVRGGFFFQALLRGFKGLAARPDRHFSKLETQLSVSLEDAFEYASKEVRHRLGKGQVPLRSDSLLPKAFFATEDGCAYDSEFIECRLKSVYKTYSRWALKLSLGPGLRHWQNKVHSVRFHFKRGKDEWHRGMTLDPQQGDYYLLIEKSNLPITRNLECWFEIEYGPDLEYKTCSSFIRVIAD